MKYIVVIIILCSITACKSGEAIKSIDEPVTWEKANFKPSKDLILPHGYSTYLLNTSSFIEHLNAGEVQLPMPNGEFTLHTVEDSQTMSEELQAKFPNIRSFKGVDQQNNLCQSRVDQKDTTFKIVIYCNDATIYIQDLHDLGLYFVYYKKDLPEGVGTVKE